MVHGERGPGQVQRMGEGGRIRGCGGSLLMVAMIGQLWMAVELAIDVRESTAARRLVYGSMVLLLACPPHRS